MRNDKTSILDVVFSGVVSMMILCVVAYAVTTGISHRQAQPGSFKNDTLIINHLVPVAFVRSSRHVCYLLPTQNDLTKKYKVINEPAGFSGNPCMLPSVVPASGTWIIVNHHQF